MKIKLHKTFSVSPEVQRLFESHKDRGYDSMSEMLEAAVRRLCGEEKQPTFDRAAMELLVSDAVAKQFAYEKPLMAIKIKEDVIEAVLQRIEPQIADDDPVYSSEPEQEEATESESSEGLTFSFEPSPAAKPSWQV